MNCADKKTGVRKRRLYNNKVKMYLQKKDVFTEEENVCQYSKSAALHAMFI